MARVSQPSETKTDADLTVAWPCQPDVIIGQVEQRAVRARCWMRLHGAMLVGPGQRLCGH